MSKKSNGNIDWGEETTWMTESRCAAENKSPAAELSFNSGD
jgi:hypothetical protein